jgi:hypothetical protein
MVPGGVTVDGLRESAIGAISTDPEALRTWRRIIKSAKLALLKGAWVVNPISGARTWQPSHHYTTGALGCSGAGMKMLAAAGWNQFEFEPDDVV